LTRVAVKNIITDLPKEELIDSSPVDFNSLYGLTLFFLIKKSVGDLFE
jgi:hypothetical protein